MAAPRNAAALISSSKAKGVGVATPAKQPTSTSNTSLSSTTSARLNVLREMSPNQRKRMTKTDLEGELKKLAVKRGSDGRPLSDLLKSELLEMLEEKLIP